VGILLILVRVAGFGTVAANVRNLRPAVLLLSGTCLTLTLLLRVFAWSFMLRQAGFKVGLNHVCVMVIGFFIGNVMPAKTGEPVTAYLISRQAEVPYGNCLSFLLSERFFEFVLLALIFLFSTLFNVAQVVAVRGIMAGLLAVIALVVLLWFGRRRVDAFLRARFDKYEAVLRHWDLFVQQCGRIIRSRRMVVFLCVVSLFFWLVQFGSAYFVYNGFGMDLNYLQVLAFTSASVLAGLFSLIPIGLPEAVSVAYCVYYGFSKEVGVSAAVFHIAFSMALYAVLSAICYFTLVLRKKW